MIDFKAVEIGKTETEPPGVFMRRYAVNTNALLDGHTRLQFREDVGADFEMRTSYFTTNNLVNISNHANPKHMLEHLKQLEEKGMLADPDKTFDFVRPGGVTPLRMQADMKMAVFRAVFGRLLEPREEYFLYKYALPESSEVKSFNLETAVLALIRLHDKSEWQEIKLLMDKAGKKVDLTGACFAPLFRAGRLSGIEPEGCPPRQREDAVCGYDGFGAERSLSVRGQV